MDTLDRSGIAGPYVAVLDPEHFNVFWQAQAGGFCVESVAGRLLTADAVCLLTPA